jgi:hypothetical protein
MRLFLVWWYVLWAEFGRFRRKFSRLIPRISFSGILLPPDRR